MFQVVFMSGLFALTLAAGQVTEPVARIGQIVGVVLDDATYQPLANARVFLYPIPFPVGGRPAFVITNQDGEYVFKGRFRIGFIAAGDYMLTVTGPSSESKPVTAQTPFVRISVVDADVSGLIIQIPIR